MPATVATISCDEVRSFLGTQISDEDCRLVMARNKELFEEAMGIAASRRQFRLASDGRTRVYELSLADLRPFEPRFTVGVLQVAAMSRRLQAGMIPTVLL